MLSRHQLPRPVTSFEPARTDQAGGRGVCEGCTDGVFTSSLRQSLTAEHDASSLTHAYSRLSRDVYTSILAGCRWCTQIGNAILTSSELDYWLQDWNGSHSDGASLESFGNDGDIDMDADGVNEIGLDEHMAAAEDSLGGEDATIAEDSVSERPGFCTIKSLDCAAKLDVKMEFLRWRGSPVFNLVRISAEVTTSGQLEDGCPLREMVGDGAVVMTLEVKCAGRVKPAPHSTSDY